MSETKNLTCSICGEKKGLGEVIPAGSVRGPVLDLIKEKHPEWDAKGFICLKDLNKFRAMYVEEVLSSQRGEFETLATEVSKSLDASDLMTRNINDEFDSRITFGDRMADRIADFGGSWKFISIFMLVLALWVIVNSLVIFLRPFDPYPFIFLNLILSCLAAIQAPVIMMSQNRQETKDRFQADNDFRTNLRAELEIRSLHDKLDYLLMHQWQRLLEIQQIQMELMEQLAPKRTEGEVGQEGECRAQKE
jgi:uncharacterized membrane protein